LLAAFAECLFAEIHVLGRIGRLGRKTCDVIFSSASTYSPVRVPQPFLF
jgi:hypothetical protein